MKKPTLRFRQVFEHPTHFKVTKPLGNPLLIAKKGLSPSMMGRLRKFSTGGEATDDSRTLDFEQERTAPHAQIDLAPRTRSLQEIEESLAYLRSLEQNVNAADVAQADVVEKRPVIKDEPIVAPAFSSANIPRVQAGALMGPPEPIAPVMMREPVAETETEPLKPTVAAPTEEESVAPTAAPAAPVAAPAVAPVIAPVAPVVSKPPVAAAAPVAAPVVAPAVKVEAKPAPAFEVPKDFDPTKELTIEAYRATKAANKGLSDQDVALGLVKQYAPKATVAPSDLDLLATKLPEGASENSVKQFDAAKDQLAQSIVNQAKVDVDTNQKLLEANQRAQAQRLINAEKDRAAADALATRRQTLETAVKEGFNPTSYFGSMGLASQIGSALSVAMGAFASGMTGMPNFALKIYENAVDRDLDIQKSKYNSLINQYNRVLGDAEDAEKLARADLNDLAALQIEGIKASSALRGVAPAADQMIATMRAKAAKEREEVALKQAEAREANVKADMAKEVAESLIKSREAAASKAKAQAAVAGISKTPPKPTVGAEAGEYENFKALTDPNKRAAYFVRTRNPQTGNSVEFIVPPKLQKSTQEDLDRRQSGLDKVKEVVRILESKPNVLKGEDLGKVQSAMADFLANVPEASGKGRMLSVADKNIYLDATQETGLPFVKNANLFHKTLSAAKQFERSTLEGIRTKVEGGIEGHPGKAELLSAYGAALGGEGSARKIRAGYVRVFPKVGKPQDIPEQNLDAAKQRLGTNFDRVER